MWEFEDFSRGVDKDDPDVLATMRRLELLRAGEADIVDFAAYRQSKRTNRNSVPRNWSPAG